MVENTSRPNINNAAGSNNILDKKGRRGEKQKTMNIYNDAPIENNRVECPLCLKEYKTVRKAIQCCGYTNPEEIY